jgi:phosphoenolpyruvate---glycerone phosphotransferase subunit DhaK
MKKFVDHPETLLETSLQGFAKAHADLVGLHTQPFYIYRKTRKTGKVILISGGGSGHEPLHSGFVGHGMLDAACPGQIFTSPTPDQMLAAAQDLDGGAGILFIVKNYAGDVMNFEMAAELLDMPNASILVDDDVSLPVAHPAGRRGVAGTVVVEKIAGAAAEQGLDLEACRALGVRAAQATASFGVALNCCTVPALGKPTFNLADDEMEIGVGIHGERGRETVKIQSASAIIERLGGEIERAIKAAPGSRVLMMINGFGGTPLIELHLLYELAWRYWRERGLEIVRGLAGNYTTSLDMSGFSLSLTVLDEELLAFWDAPVNTTALHWGG